MKTILQNLQIKAAYILAFSLLLIPFQSMFSQQIYDDYEGNAFVQYSIAKPGQMNNNVPNPSPNKINKSKKCAKYIRNKQKYDNIKIDLQGRLSEVNNYANFTGESPKIKMKMFTTAPVGTLVEIQLGKKEINGYPDGVNSQYQAYTTVKGAWEELEFKFVAIPEGSQTSFGNIDQITLLFNPNTISSDIYYFDDITGPPLLNSGRTTVIRAK